MKASSLLLPLLAACATTQPSIHSCSTPPPSPFQVIGEARTALVDSYELMAKDPEAQKRVALVDYVLVANFNFLVSRNSRYESLAGCTTAAIADVLPDMAIFATLDNTARVKRAHEMFSAMGGTCEEDQPSAPATAPTVSEDGVIDRLIEEEDKEEPLDLGPQSQ